MSADGRRPRLLFLVTEDWYFLAHRLHLARAARDAGYEVTVATRVGAQGSSITAEGFRLEALSWRRGSRNPLRVLAETLAIARLYRRVRPDIVHHVALKPIVLGSIAALAMPRLGVLNAVTGLGYLFTSSAVAARLLAAAAMVVLRPLLRRRATLTLFENEDDRTLFVERAGVPPARTAVNNGSGVDTERFRELPPPDEDPVAIGCAARLLRSKGIPDLVAASRLLRHRGVAHRLVLAGGLDPENPDAIDEATVRRWVAEDGIAWLGAIPDIRELWRRCDIAVLASAREGLPLSLVEAAACGRALVATDVPGCRVIARHGVNALLVPPGRVPELADALETLIADSGLRRRLAKAGRSVVEEGFSAREVAKATLALYARILAERDAA